MLMAKYNGSPDVTFARKGEARPTSTAGAPIPFPVRPMFTSGGHDRAGHAAAAPDEAPSRVPLGMLITRSLVMPNRTAAATPPASVVPLSGEGAASEVTTVDLQLLSRPGAAGGKGGSRGSAAIPRRQLTFRLRLEDYQALAALRNATATTFQALLERAALALIRRPPSD